MFTPREIRDTVFDKGARGYNTEDVDAFLAQLADQIETLQTEKADAESKMMMLAERLEGYRKDEDTLRSALITSERLKEAVMTEARQKAEILINDAQMKADQLTNAANQELEREEKAFEQMQEKVSSFKKEVLEMYREHLELLNKIPEIEEKDEKEEEEPVNEPENEMKAIDEYTEEASSYEKAVKDVRAEVEFSAVDDVKASDPFTAFSATNEEEAKEKTASRFGQLDFGENFSFDK